MGLFSFIYDNSNNKTKAVAYPGLVDYVGSTAVFFDADLTKGKPVSIVASGNGDATDIGLEASSYGFIGLVKTSVSSGNTAEVLTVGSILRDVPSEYSMTGQFGKPVFISPTGTLTLTIPAIGVSGFQEGDYVIYVGSLIKGSSGETNLLINPRIQYIL